MSVSYDERESLIDGVNPESVSEAQINKISMGYTMMSIFETKQLMS